MLEVGKGKWDLQVCEQVQKGGDSAPTALFAALQSFPCNIRRGFTQSSRGIKNFEMFRQDNSINMVADDRQRTSLYLKLNSKSLPLSAFQNFSKPLKLISTNVQIGIMAELLPLDMLVMAKTFRIMF